MSNLNTFSYYMRLRLDNPDLYYHPATQQKMQSDCSQLGTSIFFEVE